MGIMFNVMVLMFLMLSAHGDVAIHNGREQREGGGEEVLRKTWRTCGCSCGWYGQRNLACMEQISSSQAQRGMIWGGGGGDLQQGSKVMRQARRAEVVATGLQGQASSERAQAYLKDHYKHVCACVFSGSSILS